MNQLAGKNNNLQVFLLLLLTLGSFLCSAAGSADTLGNQDSVYYISVRNDLSLYAYGITKLNTIELRNPEGDDLIQYTPNENLNLGLGFNYRWMGISTAMNFQFLNNDDAIYGNSTSFDVQGDIYTRRTIFSGSLQTYKGFYWKNVMMYDTSWSIHDTFPQRPDMSTINIGANGFYVKNADKFSFKSACNSTEIQQRSAGSWLFGGHISYYQLHAGSYVVPAILWDSHPTYDSLVNLTTFSFGVSIGYAYTWVFWKHYFIHGTFMPGLGLQYSHASDGEGNNLFFQGKPSGRLHSRISIGSNNEDFYYGISLVLDNYPIRNESESSFVYKYGRLRFYYGQHLDYRPRRMRH